MSYLNDYGPSFIIWLLGLFILFLAIFNPIYHITPNWYHNTFMTFFSYMWSILFFVIGYFLLPKKKEESDGTTV